MSFGRPRRRGRVMAVVHPDQTLVVTLSAEGFAVLGQVLGGRPALVHCLMSAARARMQDRRHVKRYESRCARMAPVRPSDEYYPS